MSRQEHIELLASIVREDFPMTRRHLTTIGFDFAAFEGFIATNQLSGCLYSLLVTSPAGKWFPEQTLERLKSSYLRQQTRNAILWDELRRLRSAFSAHGQEFVLLKGLYLAERFYGSIDRRALWDIDIFVRKEHLQQVQKLLVEDGYVRKSRPFLGEDLSSYFTHAFDFAKNNISLDLHWSLSTHSSYHLDYDAIWGGKQPFWIEGCDFFVLADEYEIVFNLLSTLRDLERGSLRLRSFVDLYTILKVIGGQLDWQQFFANRKRENVWKISVGVLSLFLSVFRCWAEFPELARAIERERRTVRFGYQEPGAKLLEPSRFGVKQKLWAARLYQTSIMHFFLWWMISLPFRLSVYKPGKFSRFKEHLRRWTGQRTPLRR